MPSLPQFFSELFNTRRPQDLTYRVLKKFDKSLASHSQVKRETAAVVISKVLENGLLDDLVGGQIALNSEEFQERLHWEFEMELLLIKEVPESSINNTWAKLQGLIEEQSRQTDMYLEQIYQALQPSLVNKLMGKTKNSKLAEDLVQEAFVQFIEKLDDGVFDGENPYGYIKKIAEYKWLNHTRLRQNQGHNQYEEVSFMLGENGLSDSLFGIKMVLFKWAISFIFQNRHTLGYLRCMSFILYIKGYKHKEIGQRLGINTGYSRKLVNEMTKQHLLPNWQKQGG